MLDATVDVYVPVMWVLVEGKDQDTYLDAFNWVIIASDRRLAPASVSCDFELAVINAVALCRRMLDHHIPVTQVHDAMTPGKMDILTIIPTSEIRDQGIRCDERRFQSGGKVEVDQVLVLLQDGVAGSV
ncbi:hypothetical protein PC115_g12904 [Phytophthora cactorum]|uniref:Uncharacterized protein n=1 Tax=Phytophthora cactorum TaxID=29920 RepID=A0A8T1BUG5_9STRA|nr:hypothetical protein PC115_g12904 [Phytophthora cactorum]KAG2928371.1 hypothetical protein PC117_g14331 [Phytophthora cactorum]KAG3155027.1 hypothetical protein C6341_g15536 [Phytophthora cactorum]